MGYKVGDRIKVLQTDWQGTVESLNDDGTLSISLDNGISMSCPTDKISPANEKRISPQRNELGQFLPGHKKIGGAQKSGRSIRQYRKLMLQKLSPFIENIDIIIEQIEAPEDKILSISRILKYTMPALSSVEYKEGASRNLTAEENIAQLNAKYHNLPDPTENLLGNEDDLPDSEEE